MTKLHDVLILGATPAGYAAATYLAGHKYDVVVIDAPPIDPAAAPVECPLTDWVPATLFSIGKGRIPTGVSGNLVKDADAEAFRAVHYHR